eukprot:snap_masked-scaffold_3-processed-gene-5.32-mRNA-1 protein AED:1.00 eAED:1.00 QI:0/0/0/0/1/1/2/0/62
MLVCALNRRSTSLGFQEENLKYLDVNQTGALLIPVARNIGYLTNQLSKILCYRFPIPTLLKQ